jgi:hypothetical protein
MTTTNEKSQTACDGMARKIITNDGVDSLKPSKNASDAEITVKTFDPVCSVIPNAYAKTPTDYLFSEIMRRIQGTELASQTARIRKAFQTGGKTVADPLKRQLPAAMFAGRFTARGDENMIQAAGALVADIDNLTPERLAELRVSFAADPSCAGGFTSPTGTGLKVVGCTGVTDCSDSSHKKAWGAVVRWAREKHGAELDPSGKNRERLCYLAHDPAAWYNPNAVPLDLRQWGEHEAPPPPPPPIIRPPKASKSSESDLERRGLSYVRRMPESIQGSNGSAAMMAVVRALTDGFTLSGDALLRVLSTWNSERATPPWSDKELQHACESVANTPPNRPRGWLVKTRGFIQ